jgi:hypothetical protein
LAFGLATVPFPATDFAIEFNALKAPAMELMLFASNTAMCKPDTTSIGMSTLTGWNDDPKEIHHEVIAPEIISLWPTIGQVFVVMVKHRRGIV